MKISYVKPLVIPAVIIILIAWAIGEINWWLAVPIILLCADLKFEFNR